MTDSPAEGLRTSYDAVAQAYERRYGEELQHQPLDRALLRVFADEVGPTSVVGDVGCGPGHITAHLHELGLRPVGIDLSPRMIELAHERFPDVDFAVGSMLALPSDDHSWAGMVAFYSIIHLTSEELPVAFAEFRRVLVPGAPALLAFHVGDEVRHVDELLEHTVSVDFHFRQPADVTRLLQAAGFDVEMSMERAAYISIEAPTQRGYLLARAR
jgi:ubiquinone/menaquinone biosynthesis C-methylase UbiE